MKMITWKLARLSVLVLVGATLVFVGCESEDSPETGDLDEYFDNNPYVSDPRTTIDSDVIINPTAAQATHVGQQHRFDARGGVKPYTWDVSNTTRGSITPAGGSQGVYTVLQLEENSVIVYDANGHAAVAQIVLEEVEPLVAVAEDSTLENDTEKTTVSADGGTPPYTWNVDDGAVGVLDSLTGTSVVYTRLNAGDNIVVVTDSIGQTASVAISQP